MEVDNNNETLIISDIINDNSNDINKTIHYKNINNRYVIHVLNNIQTKFLPVSRFQLMTRVAQYHMVDLYSRAQDYKLNWQKSNQNLMKGKKSGNENLIFGQIEIDQSNTNILSEKSGICSKPKNIQKDRDEYENSNPNFLSASYHGGPRHLKNLAISALTVVSENGGPTIMITATVNPYWPEIVEMLLPGSHTVIWTDIT